MNFTDLIELSKAYADRYDTEVADNMPRYFLLVEARINRLLKTRKQSSRSYTSTQSFREYYDLPADWAGMRDMQLNSGSPICDYSSLSFRYADPKSFEIKRNTESGGTLYYCIIDNRIQVYPILPDGLTIEMVYFQKVPPLSSLNDSNWLSDDHPDIYLSGLCAEISLFAKDYTASDGWHTKLSALVAELDNVDWVEKWSGDPLQIRLG